jgi:hypothetical protein
MTNTRKRSLISPVPWPLMGRMLAAAFTATVTMKTAMVTS